MKSTAIILFVLLFSVSIFAQSKNDVPKDWKNFSNKIFSFYAPETLKKQDVRGKDSFIEEYRNEEMTVKFDYGFYGNYNGNCSNLITTTMDNKPAKICFYENAETDKDKPFVTAVTFANLGEGGEKKLNFWVRSKTKELQTEAEKIVRSIEFK